MAKDHLSKAEIISLGLGLGVDYSMTLSCYDPGPGGQPCGHCDDAESADERDQAGGGFCVGRRLLRHPAVFCFTSVMAAAGRASCSPPPRAYTLYEANGAHVP